LRVVIENEEKFSLILAVMIGRHAEQDAGEIFAGWKDDWRSGAFLPMRFEFASSVFPQSTNDYRKPVVSNFRLADSDRGCGVVSIAVG
jgi:hypothetical protein